MASTGIVRRIDDLGRIVIPREIRRNLHISEGDPLEICIEKDGIFLKKYQLNTILSLITALEDDISYEDTAYPEETRLIKKHLNDIRSIVKKAGIE